MQHLLMHQSRETIVTIIKKSKTEKYPKSGKNLKAHQNSHKKILMHDGQKRIKFVATDEKIERKTFKTLAI